MAVQDQLSICSRLILTGLVCGWLGCGGSSPPARTTPASSVTPAQEAAPASGAAAETPSGTTATAPTSEESTDLEGNYDVEVQEREVSYLVRPEGLQIDVAGARFLPKAKAIKVKGGWGVAIDVQASAEDERTHSLLRGNDGALAFAGTVVRRGKKTGFGDERSTGEEQLLFPGSSLTLSRKWPGSLDLPPLGRGDELVLEVGLWGLGRDAKSRRPVKRFFLVRVSVGRKRPSVLLTPPSQ
jgi:hypothetical protein